jgi:CheY-like chemotaxis protein
VADANPRDVSNERHKVHGSGDDRVEDATKHILVIEDERDIRESLKEALEYAGFRVEAVANGSEGLAALHANRHPCLILLDLMMPVMNGWAFSKAVAERPDLATIPLVVLSAFPADGVRGSGLIPKPLDLDAVIEVAERYCERGAG